MHKHTLAAIAAIMLASTAPSAIAQATDGETVSMQEAIEVAMQSNPEIIQAQFNKEAIEFERKQAEGLYAPRVNIEASAGVRRLENNTRRALNIANQELYPLEAGITGEWTAIDFGRRRGELLRQAARVDGASLRVVERSEFIALQVARQYLDILLQQRVVAAAQDNATFHEALVADLGRGVDQGSISIADRQ
ncbi:TolC family protein [Erythrobacter sp.]|uniref:TolC family protein n=1 Tax=Erythrobacter sp. TaxID=1042 RepID=UPI00311D8A05